MKARLSKWKGMWLSLVGRLCLLKSILSFVPLFFMSLFKMPSEVTDKIEKMQISFL